MPISRGQLLINPDYLFEDKMPVVLCWLGNELGLATSLQVATIGLESPGGICN